VLLLFGTLAVHPISRFGDSQGCLGETAWKKTGAYLLSQEPLLKDDLMKTTTFAFSTITLTLAICFASAAQAQTDSFGSGANAFSIDFVTIGNPGNADDTTGSPNPAGRVDTSYRIGQFEISEDMINNANVLGGLGITHDNRGANSPATSISWFEAAQFINWLNTDSGSTPAYNFDSNGNFQLWQSGDAGFNPNNLYRNSQAKYFLPSVDEWYKAAYYDPTDEIYYNFATGSDSLPTAVASGTAAGTAVHSQFVGGPADITQAGGLSPYGTIGQGGNVFEWEETDFDLVNDSSSDARGRRGGSFADDAEFLNASLRISGGPFSETFSTGFRVASTIPEPTSLLVGAFASVGLLMRRRRLG